jgi:hypothetical protein
MIKVWALRQLFHCMAELGEHVGCYAIQSFTMKMKAADSYKTIYLSIIWHHIPEDSDVIVQHCESLSFHTVIMLFPHLTGSRDIS